MDDRLAALPEVLAQPRFRALREAKEARRVALADKRIAAASGATRRAKVYFVASGAFVKIGHSRDVKRRLNDLRIGSPHPHELMLELPGGVETERHLHWRFRDHHHRGEWFRMEGELAHFIAAEREKNPTL